ANKVRTMNNEFYKQYASCIAELHGNVTIGRCSNSHCNKEYQSNNSDIRVNKQFFPLAGNESKSHFTNEKCNSCGETVLDSIIYLNEPINNELYNKAADWNNEADLLIVCGTSLVLQEPAKLVENAKKVIIINKAPTLMDNHPNVIMTIHDDVDN